MTNREKAVQMWEKEGISAAEISRRLGISRERVCQFLRPLGYSRESVFEQKKAAIQQMAAQGATKREIMKQLGISYPTIYRVLGIMTPKERSQKLSKRYYGHACEKYLGKQYGRLTIKEILRESGPYKNRFCITECRCGTVKKMFLSNVVKGYSQSCGCLHKEKMFGRHKQGAA